MADLNDTLYRAGRWVRSILIEEPVTAADRTPMATLGDLAPWRFASDNGSKFPGGYGLTELLLTDYWTLRQRSADLYERNLYARGIIRRLVTNEINVGLHLEATPEETLLGYPEDGLAEWSETVENRFALWANTPRLCDHREQNTYGAIQAAARREALVVGDVLVVMRQDQRTGLPRIQLINGASVQTPLSPAPRGTTIKHGVELDSAGRQVAYHVVQTDGTSKRLPAFGEKSGRRLAWLLYGSDKRLDDVRGKPLLSLVLQSLKEIDRFRDSTQRKAVVLSMLAMFIEKGEDKPGTRPITGGALRRGVDLATGPVADRSFRAMEHIPGLTLDELQHGEKPQAFQTQGTVETFGDFEEAILQGVAWTNGIPPEILTLSFTNNYSASQAAINEFKMYLNEARTGFGEAFCQPVYCEWLLAETLNEKVTAPGLLEAWRDVKQYDVFAGWLAADWTGQIKPSVDLSKGVNGYATAVKEGFCTRDRASRELFGMKYSKNVQKIKRENEQLAEANEAMALLEAASKPQPRAPGGESEPAEPDETDDTEETEPQDEPVKGKKAS